VLSLELHTDFHFEDYFGNETQFCLWALPSNYSSFPEGCGWHHGCQVQELRPPCAIPITAFLNSSISYFLGLRSLFTNEFSVCVRGGTGRAMPIWLLTDPHVCGVWTR
jgi:hypothetical protein